MTFGMNKILIQFTSTATAVFGVYFKLNSFIFMPIFGLNNGMVPIVAYNYGAKNKKRITHTIRLSIVSAICIMLLGLALFMIFPAQLLGLFNASGSMLQIGVPALRIICLSFTFAGFCIIVGSVFSTWKRHIQFNYLCHTTAFNYSSSCRTACKTWWSLRCLVGNSDCRNCICSFKYIFLPEIYKRKNCTTWESLIF